MRAVARALFTSAAILSAASPALAQDAPVVDRLQISLWPEHDKAEMLVMVEGMLDASTALPATVVVPFPSDVSEPHAVAKGGGEGGMPMLTPYELVDGETGKKIFLQTDDLMFRVEYYAPIAREGDKRAFEYAWTGSPSPITNLRFDARLPGDAQHVTVAPASVEERPVPTGQVSYLGEMPSVAARGVFQIDVSYERATDALVVAAMPPHPPGGPTGMAGTPPPLPPATVPPASAGEDQGSLTWLFAIGIGVLALVGAFLITRQPDEEQPGKGGSEGGGEG